MYARIDEPLYDPFLDNEDVRVDVVSNLTSLGLPADEALTDISPQVRLRGVYNLQERVRKGDQNSLSRLKQIAANEQEDIFVRAQASEFVQDWEEELVREQEKDK